MPSSLNQAIARARLSTYAEHLPEGVRHVLTRLHAEGHAAYLAGGCVRDVLLQRVAEDFDVATSARPELVQRLFPKVIPTGIQHGTVTVITGEGEHDKVEVTTFRGDGEYLDGRRPTSVHFLDDIESDLARRDFTVNAMAWDPIRDDLRDPFGGMSDLSRRRIRAVGVARDRFLEDGLRSIRAVRFASVLGFGIDTRTAEAIGETLDVFRKVATERVRDELQKLLVRSPKPSRGMELLAATGLLSCVIPELLEGRHFAQNRHHRWDVWTHTLHVLDHTPHRLVPRLSALLHDIAKPRCAVAVGEGEHTFHQHEVVGAALSTSILQRLKFPTKVVEAVALQVREHNWHYTPEWSDGAVRRRIAAIGDDGWEDFFALRQADVKGRGRRVDHGLAALAEMRLRLETERAKGNALSIKELAIGGADIMRLSGRGPGPYVGETLRQLLQKVIDQPELNTAESLSRIALELLSTTSPR